MCDVEKCAKMAREREEKREKREIETNARDDVSSMRAYRHTERILRLYEPPARKPG